MIFFFFFQWAQIQEYIRAVSDLCLYIYLDLLEQAILKLNVHGFFLWNYSRCKGIPAGCWLFNQYLC